MCGIAGFLAEKALPLAETVRAMTDRLVHRGPDDSGQWVDEEPGIALGHRRLSIVDLSPQGHQPMISACGRYVMVFNGEVYNFHEIRQKLETQGMAQPHLWRGRSDTEVMLAAIRAWGLEQALQEFVGMFAFALWDRQERALHLARDRLGEKPLYYGKIGKFFAFASELKAFAVLPGVHLEIDRAAVAAMLQFGYIPSPGSIYRGVRKLTAGSLLTVRVDRRGAFSYGRAEAYWSIDRADMGQRRRDHEARDDRSLVDELDGLLTRAVRQQMVADVPLGAFLSGGVDSSTIVALMQAQSKRPVRTFTIGFHEEAYNEAHHARAVAQHLGTDHTELYVTPHEAAAVIPRLPEIFDEPFADSSQIPTVLVSQMTRKHVTVSLSGDGGDELFGGYPRYQFGGNLWHRIRRLPRWSRVAASRSITALSTQSWDRLLRHALSSDKRASVNGHRVHRLARVLRSQTFDEMYVRLVSQWQPDDNMVLTDEPRPDWPCGLIAGAEEESTLNRMRRFDLGRYLPDDILVKVDRAAMSVSLESRAPLLDHRVVEFAWALPERCLVGNGQSKWILRQVLDRYVPRMLIERPKTGFGIPVAQWLRTELRDWAEHLLDERTMRAQGLLATAPVRRMWREHLSGTHDRQAYLWNVLMFQAWLEAQESPMRSNLGSHQVRAA